MIHQTHSDWLTDSGSFSASYIEPRNSVSGSVFLCEILNLTILENFFIQQINSDTPRVLNRMTEPPFEWNGRDHVTENNVPIVWVDGSCLNNGRQDAKSGIGCWAAGNDCWS